MKRVEGVLPVSVVIATHDRWPDLETTLQGLATIEPVREVIVIDNGSTDGTSDRVATRFPAVRLLRMDANEGVPAFGRGFRVATQPYVFLLDDDAVPARGAVRRAVRHIERFPDVAVVACHVVDSTGSAVTAIWPRNPLLFWGCGACVRRSAIEQEPYLFDPRLRLHGTEMDLAIRLYARGLCVRYLPEAVVHHRFSSTGRSDHRRLRSLTEVAVWFPLKHLPLRYAVPAVGRHLAILLERSVRASCPSAFVQGLSSALGESRAVLAERRPVPDVVGQTYFEQVFEYEPLVHRIARRFFGWPAGRRAAMAGFPDPSVMGRWK